MVGASSGLGRCIGVGLGQRGATCRAARSPPRSPRTRRGGSGPDAIAVECDVTEAASCNAAIGKAAAELGGIDALVYTPAIGPLAPLVDTDPRHGAGCSTPT